MTTDADDMVAQLRPTCRLSATEQEAMLDVVLSSGHETDDQHVTARRRIPHVGRRAHAVRATRRRRTAVLAGAAGLIAAASIIIPALLRPGSPGAADHAAAAQALNHFAHIAAVTPVSPADHLGPREYLRVVDVENQAALAGQPAVRSRFEYWIRSNGETYQWRQVHYSFGRTVENEVSLLPHGGNGTDYPSPRYLARLPTSPRALDSYLRSHTTGSTSADERVFDAIRGIVARGLASPKLRSAAIRVLSRLGHITIGDATRDSRGNPVQEFEFVDSRHRPGEVNSLLFDTKTAQITEQRQYMNGKLYFDSSITAVNVVDKVPADIRARAVRHG